MQKQTESEKLNLEVSSEQDSLVDPEEYHFGRKSTSPLVNSSFKSASKKPVITIQYQDDSAVYKEKLLELVNKGHEEANQEVKTVIPLIDKMKVEEINDKQFLQQAKSTVN